METQTEVNRYVEALQSKGLPLTAENLLDLMRPEVEELLAKHGMLSPPSQSHRASRLLALLRSNHIPEPGKFNAGVCSNESRPQMLQRFREEDILRIFMAVHRTVYILEGRVI